MPDITDKSWVAQAPQFDGFAIEPSAVTLTDGRVIPSVSFALRRGDLPGRILAATLVGSTEFLEKFVEVFTAAISQAEANLDAVRAANAARGRPLDVVEKRLILPEGVAVRHQPPRRRDDPPGAETANGEPAGALYDEPGDEAEPEPEKT